MNNQPIWWPKIESCSRSTPFSDESISVSEQYENHLYMITIKRISLIHVQDQQANTQYFKRRFDEKKTQLNEFNSIPNEELLTGLNYRDDRL